MSAVTNPTPLMEFRSAWLPHISDAGLVRIADLLQNASPLLIKGTFTGVVPMGCLASHIAWNHPKTAHLNDDAGVRWLTKVAELNPATSDVILAWDETGHADWELRQGLLAACRDELDRRRTNLLPEPTTAGCAGCTG
jgi:hypothetical protein